MEYDGSVIYMSGMPREKSLSSDQMKEQYILTIFVDKNQDKIKKDKEKTESACQDNSDEDGGPPEEASVKKDINTPNIFVKDESDLSATKPKKTTENIVDQLKSNKKNFDRSRNQFKKFRKPTLLEKVIYRLFFILYI